MDADQCGEDRQVSTELTRQRINKGSERLAMPTAIRPWCESTFERTKGDGALVETAVFGFQRAALG